MHWHQIQDRWVALQPQEAPSKNQGFNRHCQHPPLCWWQLRPQCFLGSWRATQRWRQVLWRLPVLPSADFTGKRGKTTETKIKVYKTVVLTTLLCGCELWTAYQTYARKLNHCHSSNLRKLLSIKWQDRIPDIEVLTRANLPSILTILMQIQLRRAIHVVCMPDHQLPNKLLFDELQQGKRSHEGQKKCFKDTFKASLKAFSINHNSWELAIMDRPKWWAAVLSGARRCEANRQASQKNQRLQVSDCSHHFLSTMEQNFPSVDWPD